MTVIYRAHTASESDGDCGYCRDPMVNTKCVAHTGEGFKHPIHLDCIKSWATPERIACIFCSIPTDINSLNDDRALYTSKERIVRELKMLGRDSLAGAGVGLIVFASQLKLGDDSAKILSVTEAAAISLGLGGVIALVELSKRHYEGAAVLIFMGLAAAAVAGIFPPVITVAGALKGIIDYGSPTAYESLSGFKTASCMAVSTGVAIGAGIAEGYYDRDWRRNSRILGYIGASFGAAVSSIAIGLTGLDFERRKHDLWDYNLTKNQNDTLIVDLFFSTMGFAMAAVALGTAMGGFLGRRFTKP